MKRAIYLIAIISLTLSEGFGQILGNIDPTTNQISIGVQDTLYSETLGEERNIWVHVPRSRIYGHKYPVIFLLDGEFHFESVVGIVRSNVINKLMPEMIVVAITNTNRYRDLTTSHIGDDTNPSGGAENFTKFIESELIPYVDDNYPTISHRTFIGHSLGGLVVTNTLINHSHLFNNYLAIDPSLSWNDQKLLNAAKSTISKREYENHSIYIAIANTINNDKTKDAVPFEMALKDTTTATLHLRSIVEFSKLLKSNDQLLSTWKYYPDETHGTLPVVALHEAIRFLFSWYKFDHWNEFYSPDSELTGEQLVTLITSHHDNISSKLGHPRLPNEDEVNKLGYMFLDKKDYKRAFPFFELNIKNYSKSANAYDSMGDYYNSVSDKANAIKYFSKSIELGGVNGTKEKLAELKKEK